MRYFAPIVLILSAAYALLAVGVFELVVGPFGYEAYHSLHATTWVGTPFVAVFVLIPYAILYAAHQRADDAVSLLTTATISVAVAASAAFVYFFSFRPNDGEYVFVYYVVPILQAPFALVALVVSLWRRKKMHPAA